jgi:hypothetical protein
MAGLRKKGRFRGNKYTMARSFGSGVEPEKRVNVQQIYRLAYGLAACVYVSQAQSSLA